MVMRALVILAAVLVVAALAAFWFTRGPDPAQFAHIKDPRLTRLADSRMLVVEATGDPNAVGAAAFKLLFRTYYQLEGVSRMGRPPAPRARWPKPAETPKSEWVGWYALPVPAAATAPPAVTRSADMRVGFSTWTYGEVAEVLHVGPYSTEEPDIRRLHAFVVSKGYRVIGEHEEEYVSGPGMFFPGDPNKYLTIIRVRIEAQPRATSE